MLWKIKWDKSWKVLRSDCSGAQVGDDCRCFAIHPCSVPLFGLHSYGSHAQVCLVMELADSNEMYWHCQQIWIDLEVSFWSLSQAFFIFRQILIKFVDSVTYQITCSWHQKKKPRILQLTNQKCSIMSFKAFKMKKQGWNVFSKYVIHKK